MSWIFLLISILLEVGLGAVLFQPQFSSMPPTYNWHAINYAATLVILIQFIAMMRAFYIEMTLVQMKRDLKLAVKGLRVIKNACDGVSQGFRNKMIFVPDEWLNALNDFLTRVIPLYLQKNEVEQSEKNSLTPNEEPLR